MNPSFSIRPAAINTAAAHLMIEAGPAGMSFLIADAENAFIALVVYALPFDVSKTPLAAEMEAIIQAEPLLQQQYKKTDIAWTFPEALLVPNEWMHIETAGDMLDLVYGDIASGNVKTDFMFKHSLHTVYRIPKAVKELFEKYFLLASQTHQYAVLPDLFKNADNQLYVIFYNSRLTAMLHKDCKLQAIQNFVYQDPEDAAYHLLNLCRSFDVNPEVVSLKCSGMVDESSNLYATLYKYFLNMQFAALPEDVIYSDDIKKYPAHFFSHLFATALCV